MLVFFLKNDMNIDSDVIIHYYLYCIYLYINCLKYTYYFFLQINQNHIKIDLNLFYSNNSWTNLSFKKLITMNFVFCFKEPISKMLMGFTSKCNFNALLFSFIFNGGYIDLDDCEFAILYSLYIFNTYMLYHTVLFFLVFRSMI